MRGSSVILPFRNIQSNSANYWKKQDAIGRTVLVEAPIGMSMAEMDQTEEKDKQATMEGFIDRPAGDFLVDDPDRIVQYRAVALAGGLEEGTEAQVLWAWQWLSDHPEVTIQLQEWFARRVAELRSMGRIK
jgi:hypothetical protein